MEMWTNTQVDIVWLHLAHISMVNLMETVDTTRWISLLQHFVEPLHTPLEEFVDIFSKDSNWTNSLNFTTKPIVPKGWPKTSPGYCLHLWNPPLQPPHHSQQCHCIWDNYICSGFAENDEVVAVEDFIDVGNILGKSWLSLCLEL